MTRTSTITKHPTQPMSDSPLNVIYTFVYFENASRFTRIRTSWNRSRLTAVSGNVFKLKNVEGTITRACTTAGKGGCHTGGTW